MQATESESQCLHLPQTASVVAPQKAHDIVAVAAGSTCLGHLRQTRQDAICPYDPAAARQGAAMAWPVEKLAWQKETGLQQP